MNKQLKSDCQPLPYSLNYKSKPYKTKYLLSNHLTTSQQQSPLSILNQELDTKRSNNVSISTKYPYQNNLPIDRKISTKLNYEEIKKKYICLNKNVQSNYVRVLQQSNKLNKIDVIEFKNRQLKQSIDYESFKQGKSNQEAKYLDINFINKSKQLNQECHKKLLESSKGNIQQGYKLEQQRIQSIDKINQKIQKIMNCIQQNQKSNQNSKKFTPIQHHRRASHGQSIHSQYQKSYDKVEQKILCQKIEDKLINNNQSSQHKQKKGQLIPTRSTSLLNRGVNSDSKDLILLIKGKDINAQIMKIHQKIRKSQEQKKKLNIKFQGYEQYKRNSTTQKVNKNRQQKYNLIGNRSIQKSINSKLVKEQNIIKKNHTSQTSDKKFINLQVPKIPKLHTINQNKKYYPNKIIEEQSSIDKIQTKKITDAFKFQVELDAKLRDGKLVFYNTDSLQKWDNLSKQLQKLSIILTTQQLKSQFQVTLQENDPFFSVRQLKNEESIQMLARKYNEANKYFKQNIKGKFKRKSLQQERFEEKKLDLQKKGYLSVQDFVRYLNIETGTFYRNRDLILLFRRLIKQDSIKFEDLIKILTE